jgi:hypothetical protein
MIAHFGTGLMGAGFVHAMATGHGSQDAGVVAAR